MSSTKCNCKFVVALVIVSIFIVIVFFLLFTSPSSTATTITIVEVIPSSTTTTVSPSTSKIPFGKDIINCSKHFAFFGDSNTLGMRWINQKIGWRLAGGYPRYVLREHKKYSSSSCSTSDDNHHEISNNSINSDVDGDEDPHANFTAPTRLFAIGGATLAGVGEQVRLFTKSEDFFEASKLFSKNNDENINMRIPLDVAFIMFGTNDCVRANFKNTTAPKYIYEAYRRFIKETIIEKFGPKHVVVVTPPKVLPFCRPRYCLTHDRNILEYHIVLMLRKLVAELRNESEISNEKKITIDLVDFYEYQSNMVRLNGLKVNSSKLYEDFYLNHVIMNSTDNQKQQQQKFDSNSTTSPSHQNIILSDFQRKLMELWLLEYETLKGMYQGDGVHLSVHGHKMLGRLVWEKARKIF